MLGDARPTAFLATADSRAARDFYCGALGLSFVDETDFALVLRTGGVTLRIQKVEKVEPQPYTVLGWQVPDLATLACRLTRTGIPAERFDTLEQDDLGIWTSPAGARVLWFRDPDGNLLSLTELATGQG